MGIKPESEDVWLPTRASLLSRLRDWDDHTSWQEFFEAYWKLIYRVALRAGLSESEAQDVVQETVLSVAKQLPKFRYDPAKGSFKTWLYQMTQWRIKDHFRRRPKWQQNRVSSDPGQGDGNLLENLPDEQAGELTESVWDAEWRQNLVDRAMTRIKRRISPKHYQIFDLYVIKEWPVDTIRKTLSVSRAQIYVVKHRVASMIKKEVQALQRELEGGP